MSKRKRDGPQPDIAPVRLEDIVTPDLEELCRQSLALQTAYRDVQARQKATPGPWESVVTQDFTIALSRAILSVHFGIHLSIPSDRLCPPIPNRYFFCQWLEHLLYNFGGAGIDHKYYGLDIGTGASAIYPLLWTHRNENMRFLATEIDPVSLEYAQANVRNNQLDERIQVVGVNNNNGAVMEAGPLRQSLKALPPDHSRLDICMVNPPFYAPGEIIDDKPNRTRTTNSEGFYPGGEVGFVTDMLYDCLQLMMLESNNQTDGLSTTTIPRLLACMCGKKESFVKLKHLLSQVLGRSHVQETQFGPGHHTRWFLAWTMEPPTLDAVHARLGPPTTLELSGITVDEFSRRLVAYFQSIRHDTELKVNQSTVTGNNTIAIEVLEAHATVVWTDDGALPSKIRYSLPTLAQRVSAFLPGSHLFLRLVVVGTDAGDATLTTEAFVHSDWGKRKVEQWMQQMPGEITRTNRKWRRLLKRQLQQQQQTGQQSRSAMDTSTG